MATVKLNKIIDKFIRGECMIYHQRNESLPLEYFADLNECANLEDLICAVEKNHDLEGCQSYKYVLNVLDYDDKD